MATNTSNLKLVKAEITDQVDTTIANYGKNADTIDSEIKSLQDNLKKSDSNISDNKSNISSNKSNISTNKNNIASNLKKINDNKSAVNADIKKANNNIDNNKDDIANNSKKINENKSAADDDVKKAHDDIASNKSNIASNLEKINGNKSDISTNAGNIESKASTDHVDNLVYEYSSNEFKSDEKADGYDPKPNVAVMEVSGDSSFPHDYGTLVTFWSASDRSMQIFTDSDQKVWTREVHTNSYPEWSDWAEMSTKSYVDSEIAKLEERLTDDSDG